MKIWDWRIKIWEGEKEGRQISIFYLWTHFLTVHVEGNEEGGEKSLMYIFKSDITEY